MELEQNVTDAVFAAAQSATWVDTNLGPMAHVTVDGTQYTVDIHRSGRHLAAVTYVMEWGNVTAVQGAHASPEQHRALARAATTALGCWVRR
ncbi:hypothetical protein ACH4PU_32840 [Streptomyces sp. NPDC021100]|uniref:hypothetical protein n=1 Tax=Streptomyces sp. NPDC021100 TaxID=3365114 RepID=UPI0037A31CFB